METTKFTWNDGQTFYEGVYYTRQRWNGFACPMFTLEVVQDIAKFCDKEGTTETIEITDGRVWSIWEGTDRYEVEAVTVDGVDFYPVGAMGWVWVEAESFQQ